MSAAKTERLLNLVICLLSTRRPLTKSQIRAAVPQYADNPSVEAFERMFERDKDELRDLGVPLVTTSEDPLFEDEVGYRVDRDAYALPDVAFEPDELAVVGLASRVWQQATLGAPAARALLKLRAAGVEPDSSSLIGVEPRVRTSEPAFDPLYAAVRDRTPVTFTYRTASSGEVAERHVEPWAVTSWRGRWYLTGHDRDRGAPRVFRLGRIEGAVRRSGKPGEYDVPPDHDARAMVGDLAQDVPDRTATLRLRGTAGQGLRRRSTVVEEADEGWFRVTVPFGDAEQLGEEVASYGPDVVVEGPADVRDAVVRRLRAVVGESA